MRLPFQRSTSADATEATAPVKRSRSAAGADTVAEPPAVAAARIRARRRLIGAVVLLAVGIVTFPMLFETQPRPIAGDIPIQVAQRATEGRTVEPAPTLPVTTEPAPTLPVTTGLPAAVAPAAAPLSTPLPPPTEARSGGTPAAASAPLLARPAPMAAPAQVQVPPPASVPVPVPDPAMPVTPRNDDGARALALLQGAATPPVQSAGRYVVQVGAYSDATAMRNVRGKVEKLGLKTYTQVVSSPGGQSTRVRVGPFGTRDEADAAAAKLRAGGLPAAVLTL